MTDNLAAELAALRTTRPRLFKDWLTWADPEDVRVVMEAVMDSSIGAGQLSDTLRKHDIPITPETIGRYRESAK